MEKLARLKQELKETESLLQSPRVSDTTRYVLNALRDDLKKQIAELDSAEVLPTPEEPSPDTPAF